MLSTAPGQRCTAAGISSATSGGFSSSGAGDDGSSAATCAGAGSAFSSSSGKPSAATGAWTCRAYDAYLEAWARDRFEGCAQLTGRWAGSPK